MSSDDSNASPWWALRYEALAEIDPALAGVVDTTTELELRWYAPAWEGEEVPQEHRDRMELFATVMAQDTANMAATGAAKTSHFGLSIDITLLEVCVSFALNILTQGCDSAAPRA